MPPRLSNADVATLIDEANRAARRLHRKLHLPPADLEDISQDLLLDLICRLPGFDKRRGSIGAFANIVLRNECARIAIRHHRQRWGQGGAVLSVDAPVPGSIEPLGSLLAASDGLAAWHGQDNDAEADIQTRAAVQSVVARLSDADRRFCCALAYRSVTELAAEGFGSRSALYRRRADLRQVLTAHGLGPCWDDFQTA